MRDINFFEPYKGRKKEKLNFIIYIYSLLSIAGILIIGSLVINSTRIFLIDKDIATYNTKLSDSEIQKQLKEAEDTNVQINTLKQYDEALTDILIQVKQRDNVSDELLNDIGSTVPSEVSFKNLDITDNTISIEGVSTNRTAVAELKHNLSALSKMEDVYVNSIDNASAVEGEYSFDIKCVLRDVE